MISGWVLLLVSAGYVCLLCEQCVGAIGLVLLRIRKETRHACRKA